MAAGGNLKPEQFATPTVHPLAELKDYCPVLFPVHGGVRILLNAMFVCY